MLFKIHTKLVTSKKQFRNQTASIFFIDISEDKKSVVKKLEKQFDLTLNDYQKTLLFDDKKDELTLHKSEGRPDIIFICKTRKNPDLNTNFFRNILAGIIQRLENEEIRELTRNEVRGYDHGWINLGISGKKP